jgi:hypothetical protein
MSRREDTLFHKYDLGSVIEGQRRAVSKAVAALSEAEILSSTVESLAERFEREYLLSTPVLHENERFMEKPQETDIEVFDPWEGRRVRARGYRMTLVVPFKGDHELFFCHPSTFTYNPPHAGVAPGTLTITRGVQQINADELKKAFDAEFATIKQWLGWVDGAVKTFNGTLRSQAQQKIERRREELKKAQDALAALGLPIKGGAEAPRTYSAPLPQPSRPPSMPQAAPVKPLEPELAQQHYEHILSVVQHFAKTMERAPASFASMGEEEIRDHLLAHLNGHYPGQATGETFNVAGKTDILVRWQDQNLFIAECKIWEGQVAFAKAIDQLRGYLGWRDRKAALFVFNRRKDVSQVLKKIRAAVQAHAAFKRELTSPLGEGSFRFVLSQPNDESAELLTSVLVFDVPKPG